MAKIKDEKKLKSLINEAKNLGIYKKSFDVMSISEVEKLINKKIDQDVKASTKKSNKPGFNHPGDVIKVKVIVPKTFFGGFFRLEGEEFRIMRKDFNDYLLEIVEVLTPGSGE